MAIESVSESAEILEFPNGFQPAFDPNQRLHKLAQLVAQKSGCTFPQALANCRAAFAQMKREQVERGGR